MYKESLLSLALVVLVEAISAVIEYLKHKLMSHLNRNSNNDYGEFA